MISIIFLDFVLDMGMIYIHHLCIIRNYRKRREKSPKFSENEKEGKRTMWSSKV